MRTQLLRAAASLGALLAISGCTFTAANIPLPRPNVLAHSKFQAAVTVDTSAVPNFPICSKVANGSLCVEDFRTPFNQGMGQLIPAYFSTAEGAPPVTAQLRVISYEASPIDTEKGKSISYLNLALRWQFQLLDASGQPLLQLAETTFAPRPTTAGDHAETVRALIEATLERIGAGLDTLPAGTLAALPLNTPPGPMPSFSAGSKS